MLLITKSVMVIAAYVKWMLSRYEDQPTIASTPHA